MFSPHAEVMEPRDQLTSGQAARILGCSRQHVVDLCDSGKLPCSVIGSHRRIARADLKSFLDTGRALRREEERSLWLHRALVGPLLRDPDKVLAHARANIIRWRVGLSFELHHQDDPQGSARSWR